MHLNLETEFDYNKFKFWVHSPSSYFRAVPKNIKPIDNLSLKAIELYTNGERAKNISLMLKKNINWVYRAILNCEKHNVTENNHDRNNEFIRLFTKEAKTLSDIGLIYNISRERVRQVLKKLGVDQEIGGRGLKKYLNHKDDIKPYRREQQCMNWYGCSIEIRNSFGDCNVKGTLAYTYKTQKNNSLNHRKIPFELTLPEWYEIWKESGHFHERGIGSGKYVMARIADMGSYTKDNVKIITHNENSRESREMDFITGKYKGRINIAKLARENNIYYGTLVRRIKSGLSLEESLIKTNRNANKDD